MLHSRNVGKDKSSLGQAAAAWCLRVAASEAGDERLQALAVQTFMSSQGHVDKVISAIEDMIAKLQKEEKTDLKSKEESEGDLMDVLREAAVIDEACKLQE